MKGKIMGLSPVSFPDTKTGELIEGTSVFVAYADANSFGEIPCKIWIKAGSPLESKLASYLVKPASMVGLEVDFSFKPKSSKVAQFDIVSK